MVFVSLEPPLRGFVILILKVPRALPWADIGLARRAAETRRHLCVNPPTAQYVRMISRKLAKSPSTFPAIGL